MVKISDRGDAIANQNLKPLSSAEQNFVSESKSNQKSSRILDETDQIINYSKRLIKTYNNLQQEWDALPEELDPDNEFSQMMEEINISRKLKETFEQIKNQNQECRYWIEQIELMHKTSKLPTTIFERYNTITSIRNNLVGIIVDNWDEERLSRNIAADPELGYDPYDPAYKQDLSWDEIYSKYEIIITQNNRLQTLLQNESSKFEQLAQQKEIAIKNNNEEELNFSINTTLNTINTSIDSTYELDLLTPQCHYLYRAISSTPPAVPTRDFINKKTEMLTQLGHIINFAEERLDGLKNLNISSRNKYLSFLENSHNKNNSKEQVDNKEQLENVRSNLQWDMLIAQASTIINNIQELAKEGDRLYKIVKDITAMSETDCNKNKGKLRYAIEGVIDISQRVTKLYVDAIEVKNSMYSLARAQNKSVTDLPDNIQEIVYNIIQLISIVEDLSNRADEVEKLITEDDTEEKILDIDNFGKKSLLENKQKIEQSDDAYDLDDLDPNAPILQEHDDSSNKNDLKESSNDQEELINANPASSDQNIAAVNEDSSELNNSNEQSAQSIISTDENKFQEITKGSNNLTNSTQQTDETEQPDLQEAVIPTQQTTAEIQQVEQETKSESKAAEQTMQASVSSDQITSLCNAITQLQQQIEALTSQQEQTNMQVRAQANNTLAMTMQLEQINTHLSNISKRLGLYRWVTCKQLPRFK